MRPAPRYGGPVVMEIDDDPTSVLAGFDPAAAPPLLVDTMTDPTVRFVLDVGDSVSLRDGRSDDDVPCLRGNAVEPTEALSPRSPMRPDAPTE